MPPDSRHVTCDDCFFRRELLCALRLPRALSDVPPRDARRARPRRPQARLVAPRSTVEASATLRA